MDDGNWLVGIDDGIEFSEATGVGAARFARDV